jgi:hypothetical protein
LLALFKKLPPSVTALLLQFSGFFFTLLLIRLTNAPVDFLSISLLGGVLAAILSYFSGLARWWLPIQLIFAPALVLMLEMHIPSEFFLVAFLVMLAIYWSTFRSQVPLYLSSKRVWQTLEELLPAYAAGKRFTFMDIGSGMGGVLSHLADVRPDGDYYGVENAPLPCLLSRIILKLGHHTNCQIQWQSLWECDLALYDVVFAYLSPVPMEKLWHKVKLEMRPGTLFISNSFAVPEQPPQYSITLDDMHHSTLHIWHM